MRKAHFVQADVFSDSPFGGNPVVVVPDPGPMTPEEMQSLARGMSFSETAFVLPPRDHSAAFGLRCFTPTTEVVFSGHQMLGAAFVMAELGRVGSGGSETELYVEVGDELHSVVLSHLRGSVDRVAMVERAARFGSSMPDISPVTAALSIDAMAILQTGLPVEVVETGLACLVVPVRSLHDIQALMPVAQAIHELLTEAAASCLVVFCMETLSAENDLHVRVFAPPLGIREDPATGTANAALAAYLVRHGIWTPDPTLRVKSEQGSEVGRPSLIEMAVDATSEPMAVLVGGRVAKSVEGTVFY